MKDDIDEYTVWIGLSCPLVKIGLGLDCWTSYVVFPSRERAWWRP